MSGRNLLEGHIGPVTQSREAVKTFIEYVTGKPCKELPVVFKLADGSQLTKSSKGDVFYFTSQKVCTCPGFSYRRTCKHVTSLQSGNTVEASRAQARAYQARQREQREKAKACTTPEEHQEPAKRLARPPEDSVRPAGKWPGGFNGPVNMPPFKDLKKEMAEQGYEMSFEADY